jgi:hypothetical protein
MDQPVALFWFCYSYDLATFDGADEPEPYSEMVRYDIKLM